MPPFFCLKRHGVRNRVLDAVDTVINALTDAGFMITVADAPAKSAEGGGGTGAQQADNTAFLVVSITINEVRNLYVMQLNLHFLLLIKTLPKGQYDLPFLVYAISQRPL